MKNTNIVAAIDIGSTHIIAAIAKILPTGEVKPIAFSESPSKGVKKGGITNITLVQHAVDTVLDELQMDGNYHIHSIITAISGVSIIGHNAAGSTQLRGSPITFHNITQAVADARDSAMLDGRELLHLLPQSFIVDKQTDIDNPMGLLGDSLKVRMHVISTAKTAANNLLQVFSHRDVDVEHIVSAGYASALAVTTADERQLGICVLDIGSGTTDITIIGSEVAIHSDVIPLGGELITNDIAFFMRSTIDNAEAIKQQIDISNHYLHDDFIEVSGLSEVSRQYTKQDIANVSRKRCEELIDMVMQKIRRAGMEDCFPAGFVICGGSANLLGFDKLLLKRTQLPVRIAQVAVDLPNCRYQDSRFATIMGLFLCDYQQDYIRVMTNKQKTGIIGSLAGYLAKITTSLQRHF